MWDGNPAANCYEEEHEWMHITLSKQIYFFLRGKMQDAFGVQSSEKTAASEGLGNSLTSVIRKWCVFHPGINKAFVHLRDY